MGAGADEQMAGYARHRQKFANGGWPLLVSEIEMEMNRISERNLGRDNRILADHGRAPRLPYLDEMVVEYLAQLPIWTKVDLRLPIGLGDKIILRALAFQMGLNKTAIEPKRAIQFGSRIAKTEARKEKGSQICDRLTKSLVLEQ
jgi:asparagine synthetase B (glutamine-hydrolysing)